MICFLFSRHKVRQLGGRRGERERKKLYQFLIFSSPSPLRHWCSCLASSKKSVWKLVENYTNNVKVNTKDSETYLSRGCNLLRVSLFASPIPTHSSNLDLQRASEKEKLNVKCWQSTGVRARARHSGPRTKHFSVVDSSHIVLQKVQFYYKENNNLIWSVGQMFIWSKRSRKKRKTSAVASRRNF